MWTAVKVLSTRRTAEDMSSEQLYSSLKRLAKRRLRCAPEEKDDIVQDAWLKLERQVRQGRKFNDRYLCRTLHSVFINKLKRDGKFNDLPIESLIDDPQMCSDPMIRIEFEDCLRYLHPKRRNVLFLTLLGGGFSVREAATFLKQKYRAVENLASKGKADLLGCLGKKGLLQ